MKNKVVITLLFLYGCSSPSGPPELTPITTNGANTISFLINGNVFLPSSAENGFNIAPPAYSVYVAHETWDSNYWVSQIIANTSSQPDVFEIDFDELLDTGTFRLGLVTNVPRAYAMYVPNGDNLGYFTRDSLPAWINISRFDTNVHVLSGTFAMTMEGGPSRDSIVQITNGRFDFHYTP
jgi:hypothetical protein